MYISDKVIEWLTEWVRDKHDHRWTSLLKIPFPLSAVIYRSYCYKKRALAYFAALETLCTQYTSRQASAARAFAPAFTRRADMRGLRGAGDNPGPTDPWDPTRKALLLTRILDAQRDPPGIWFWDPRPPLDKRKSATFSHLATLLTYFYVTLGRFKSLKKREN